MPSWNTPNKELTAGERAERKRLKREAHGRRQDERAIIRSLNLARANAALSHTAYTQALGSAQASRRPGAWKHTSDVVSDSVRLGARDKAARLAESLLREHAPTGDEANETNELLVHMLKGTQTLVMFTALSTVGYTRRKFTERALLMFDALRLLHERASPHSLQRCRRYSMPFAFLCMIRAVIGAIVWSALAAVQATISSASRSRCTTVCTVRRPL